MIIICHVPFTQLPLKIALCKTVTHSHNQSADTDSQDTMHSYHSQIPHGSFVATHTSFQIQGHILCDSIYMKHSEYSQL